MPLMKILVTGVSGSVGPGVVKALAAENQLRLLDLDRRDDLGDHEWIVGSILDANLLADALHGVDGVVHLAAIRSGTDRDQTTDAFFDVNVKGLYLLLEAAARSGVKRFVHVGSTAPIIGNWYEGANITVDSPLTTRGRYSLTKALQEKICEHFTRNADMQIVVLRPWLPADADRVRQQACGQKDAYSPGLLDSVELGQACERGLVADGLGKFEVFHTVATEEAKARFDASRTEKLLGWSAKDDFADLTDDSRRR